MDTSESTHRMISITNPNCEFIVYVNIAQEENGNITSYITIARDDETFVRMSIEHTELVKNMLNQAIIRAKQTEHDWERLPD